MRARIFPEKTAKDSEQAKTAAVPTPAKAKDAVKEAVKEAVAEPAPATAPKTAAKAAKPKADDSGLF